MLGAKGSRQARERTNSSSNDIRDVIKGYSKCQNGGHVESDRINVSLAGLLISIEGIGTAIGTSFGTGERLFDNGRTNR